MFRVISVKKLKALREEINILRSTKAILEMEERRDAFIKLEIEKLKKENEFDVSIIDFADGFIKGMKCSDLYQ